MDRWTVGKFPDIYHLYSLNIWSGYTEMAVLRLDGALKSFGGGFVWRSGSALLLINVS